MTEPLHFQHEGIAFLSSNPTAMLADDPGLGKTFQAIRACDAARCFYVLVICPASLIANWKKEIGRYRKGDWQALVVSYERATKDVKTLSAQRWCAVVIDEGHYLKEWSAKRTEAVYGRACIREKGTISSAADRVWVLTGTPMPNHAGELWTHLRALRPDLIASRKTGQPWSFHQFIHIYCKLRDNGFGYRITGSKNEDKLHDVLKQFMLRRRKSDVLKDLPPIRFGTVYLEANITGIPEGERLAVKKVLEAEGATGLRHLTGLNGTSTLRRMTGLAKAGPAIEWIKNWLDSTDPSEKIVVFGHHREVLDFLYAKLRKNAVVMHGYTNAVQDANSIEKFQNDPIVRVFLGNIQKAGVGLTLTAASNLIFLESSWVPADMEQAAQRIHRIGQANPCLVRFFTVPDTIDEDIQKAVRRKLESISRVVDGVEFSEGKESTIE